MGVYFAEKYLGIHSTYGWLRSKLGEKCSGYEDSRRKPATKLTG